MSYAAVHEDDHHDHKPTGIGRWLFSTNHKDIGTMYLVFALIMFFVGGAMAMVIRAELFQPGLQYVDPQFFNSMTTIHALVMIFGALMPAGVGLANWMIPMMIGAPDMAMPRMNNMSFWILPFAFTLLLSTFFMQGGAPAAGWTMYPPLVLQMGDGFPFLIFAIHFLGLSSIMGAINIIATVFNMRAPHMGFMKLPLFVWTWIITAFLLIAAMPVFAGAVTMLLTDKYFGTAFFDAAGGGDPVMFQHLFWFFGHPEVYIVALPAFGMVSDVLATHARKNIFGYRMMVWAILAIGGLSFVVWAHHMYVSGMNPYFGFFFATTTLIIAIPTALKVYNWVLTLWQGNIHLRVPMLFAIAFIFTFVHGGLTGLFLGNVVVDLPLSDTYFVVAHFHMVMGVSPVLVVFASIYHWFPKMSGRMFNETLGRWHFWLTFLGTYSIYLPMHYLGFLGVPRRYYAMGTTDFIPESAQTLNATMTIAAIIVALAQLIFLYNMVISLRNGKKSGPNPWGATTLEWQTPDTPPKHGNWGDELPVVHRWPYDYSVPGEEQDFTPQTVPASEVPVGRDHGVTHG
ncbi:MAG: cytochrome c oxidase subunit I [Proteobacteria bacterium]|nr:cytochrome c oxidase subunit I [Pseudomonadota bacterium]